MKRQEEIERQFLVNRLPNDLSQHPYVEIRQGYLCVTEAREVRLRAQDDEFVLTIKDGQGVSRTETEVALSQDQFAGLWPATQGQRIEKRRYLYPVGDDCLHLDCYLGELAGFYVLEAEFPNLTASREFMPPSFCDEEITEKGSFFFLRELLAKKITR